MRYPSGPVGNFVFVLIVVLMGLMLLLHLVGPRSPRRPPLVLPPGFAPDGSRFAPLTPATPPAPDTVWLVTEQRREVAPGLVVEVRGTPVSSDPDAVPRRVLTIRRGGHIIYADTAADFLYSADTTSAGRRLYPLWILTGRGRGELLVRVASPPDFDLVRRFAVSGQHVSCRDTLPAFDASARNLDRDAWLEYGGYRQSGEQWTDEQGHFWQAYNPRLYYEQRPTGLVLDAALTQRKALAQYGVFRGYRFSENPGVRVHRP